MDLIGPSLVLLGLGGVFWLAVWLIGRRIGKDSAPPISLGSTDDQQDAILVLKPGGKVVYANVRIRQMFHLADDEPVNLENLARRLRPSEQFLALAVREGQERFVLDGKLVHASSFSVSVQQGQFQVISLRRIELVSGLAETRSGMTTELLQTFSEVSESITANLDLLPTIQSIMESITKFLLVDFFEIGIWEEETGILIPYQYSSLREVNGKVIAARQRYHIGEGLAGKIVETKQPVLLSYLSASQLNESGLDPRSVPIQSYLGVPLKVRDELIGTLSIGSYSSGTYQQEDLSVVDLISGQASTAIRNARLYARENQRASELTGIGELAQAVISSRDPSALFSRLVQNITELFHFEIIGFLIFNPNRRMLEAQQPYVGLPEQFVEMYRLPVPLESDVEKVVLSQSILQAKDARIDEVCETIGIREFALAAGMRDTLLLPLVSGGRMLGFLQFSNAADGPDSITKDLLRLLQIVTNQVAPLIENAELVQRSRERALRAEGLGRLAAFASSAASLDEILDHSSHELSGLLRPDFCLIFLVDMDRTRLVLHRTSLVGDLSEALPNHVELLFSDPQFPFTFTARRRSYVTGVSYARETALVPFYQQVLDAIQAQSWIVAPLISHNEGLGEIWLVSKQTGFFTQIDLQFLTTAASQIASVVDQAYLSAQTDASLQRRVEQLTVMTRISRELSTSLDLQHLLHLVYEEALLVTGASCGTLFMLDLSTPTPWDIAPRFYVGDVPPEDLSEFEIRVLESGTPVNLGQVSDEPSLVVHEGVRSALIVPIQYQLHPAGLMILHANEEDYFDDSSVEIALSLAAQAAIALGNALQYEKQKHRGELLQRQNETLQELGRIFAFLGKGKALKENLDVIAQSIRNVFGFEGVIISQFEMASGKLLHRAVSGEKAASWHLDQEPKVDWPHVQSFLLPEYQMDLVYYVAGEKDIFRRKDLEPQYSQTNFPDLLVLPLYTASNRPLGLVSICIAPTSERPERLMFESLAMFGLLAGWVMEKSDQLSLNSDKIIDLERANENAILELGRMKEELERFSQSDSAQVKTIHSLYRQMEQMLDGIEIAEMVNRQADIPSALTLFAKELLSRFDMETVLIGEKRGTEYRLVETIGSIPGNTNLGALFGQHNTLREILQTGNIVFHSGNGIDERLSIDPLLRSLTAKNYVGFSLPINEEFSVAVLAVGHGNSIFQEHTERMYTQLGKQVLVSLQNLDLLSETRQHLQNVNILLDFSRSLGTLNERDILRSLLRHISLVLGQTEAGWVGIYDKDKGELTPSTALGYADSKSILRIHYIVEGTLLKPGEVLSVPARVCLDGEPKRLEEVQFASDFYLAADDLLHYRKGTAGKLPLSSLCVPLKLGDQVLGVLLVENFTITSAFTQEDEVLAYSLAQQAALALENSRLYSDVDRRAKQLEMLTGAVAEMGASLNRENLLEILLTVLHRVIQYDTATLWLRHGQELVVSAVNGFADGDQRLQLSAAVEDSVLFQEMIATSKPICVGDVRKDGRFSALIEPEYLSWLGVPLVVKGELLGVIALEKKETEFFGADLVQSAATFASMAASALENARLYELSLDRATALDLRSERLGMINRFSSTLNRILQVEQAIQVTAEQLLSSLEVDRVAVIRSFNGENQLVEYMATGVVGEYSLPDIPLFDYLRESRGTLVIPKVDQETSLQQLCEEYFRERKVVSLLAIPLISGEDVFGWIWLMKNHAYNFSPEEIELVRTLGNQAAIAIENARLFEETHNLKEDLEVRVKQRTTELMREHTYTQALLTIISKLSVGLDSSRVIVDVLEDVNKAVGADSSLILRSDGSRNYYAGLTSIEITKMDGGMGRNLWDISRHVVRNRQTLLIEDTLSDQRWNREWTELAEYHSLTAIPMILEEEPLGTLFLLSRQQGVFQSDQLSLVEAAARQFSIALNNANLYHLAKNQSESLSIMLRNQQTILESIVDGVLVTDLDNRVALFNPSAERILNLSTMDVIGRSLDQFSGLFGRAASEWMNKIKQWSSDPFSYQSDEIHAETLQLENGHIVSVNLAPVVWGMEFLGTVSIFRDITNEVMLDRLKSEFVANVSHELRTPLTAIKGYMEILLMGAVGELNSQQMHFLQVVNNNADRLNILVDDLLDVSRIEAGQVELNITPIDLQVIAMDVLGEAQRRVDQESKPMSFDIQVDPDLPRVLGDALRVRQVLSNLVSNAYQYTPSNGEIKIRLERHNDDVKVSVQDNGIGIEPEYQERIFERFFRGEDPLVLATAGTGLGLAISKTMIEMQGGHIWFTSSGVRGEGSTFSFTLPVSGEG